MVEEVSNASSGKVSALEDELIKRISLVADECG